MAALHNPLDKKTQHIMCDIDAVFQAVSSWAAELTAQGEVLATAHSKSSKLSASIGHALELKEVPECFIGVIRRVSELAYERGFSDAELAVHSSPLPSRDSPSHPAAEDWSVVGDAQGSDAGSSQPSSQTHLHPPASGASSGCPFFNKSSSRKLQAPRSVQVSSLVGPYNRLSLSIEARSPAGSVLGTAGNDAGDQATGGSLPCSPPGRNCLSDVQPSIPRISQEGDHEEGGHIAPDTPQLESVSHGAMTPSTSCRSAGYSLKEEAEAQQEAEDRVTWGLDPLQDKDIAEELYSKMGGWEVLAAAVQDMYQRLTKDPCTSPFFKGSNTAKLNRHMTAFMGAALSGRIMFPPHVIWRMHKRHCGLTPEHVDVMAGHFKEVLDNLNMDPGVVADAVRSLHSMRWVFAYKSAEEVMSAAALHHAAH